MRFYTPIDFVLKAGKPVYKFFNEEELKKKNYYNQKTLEHCMAISVPAAPGVYEIPSGCAAGTKKFVGVQQTNQPPVTTSMQFFENCAPSSVPSSDVNNAETNDEEKPNDEVLKDQGCAVAGDREKAQTAADHATLRQLLMDKDIDGFIKKTIANLHNIDALVNNIPNPLDILVHDDSSEVTIRVCDKPLTVEAKMLVAALKQLYDYIEAIPVHIISYDEAGSATLPFKSLESMFQNPFIDVNLEKLISMNESLKSSHGIDMQGEWAPSASDALFSIQLHRKLTNEEENELQRLNLCVKVGAARGLKARKQKVESAALVAVSTATVKMLVTAMDAGYLSEAELEQICPNAEVLSEVKAACKASTDRHQPNLLWAGAGITRAQEVEIAAGDAVLARSEAELEQAKSACNASTDGNLIWAGAGITRAQELALVHQGATVVTAMSPGADIALLERFLANSNVFVQPEGGHKIHQIEIDGSDEDFSRAVEQVTGRKQDMTAIMQRAREIDEREKQIPEGKRIFSREGRDSRGNKFVVEVHKN